jgi:hypothetical protein
VVACTPALEQPLLDGIARCKPMPAAIYNAAP